MLATPPVRSHDPPDLGAQGLAVEAPAVRPGTAGVVLASDRLRWPFRTTPEIPVLIRSEIAG